MNFRALVCRISSLLCVVFCLPATARADFVVSGRFKYKERPLRWVHPYDPCVPCWEDGLVDMPIRLAVVKVIDRTTGAVLAETHTDVNGGFLVTVVGSGSATIRVRCYSRVGADLFGQGLVYRVTDDGNVEYSVASISYANWNFNTNLNIGTVKADQVLLFPQNQPHEQYLGSPFGQLDQLVWGLQYIHSSNLPHPFDRSCAIVWPYFGGGSVYNKVTQKIGMAFDAGNSDNVLLHEIGHWSRDATGSLFVVGGPHSFANTDVDPNNAFQEGWASVFAALTQQYKGGADPGHYLRCSDAVATYGGNPCAWYQIYFRFENGFNSVIEIPRLGGGSEAAACTSLWDIIDTAATNDGQSGDDDPVDGSFTFPGGISGERFVWNGFLDGVFRLASWQTQELFWNTIAPVDPSHFAQVDAAINEFGFGWSNDVAEPNDVSQAAVQLPISTVWYPSLLSPALSLYHSAATPPVPGYGDVDYFTFPGTPGQSFTVETAYPSLGCGFDAQTDCDPRLVVYAPDGTTMGESNDAHQCDNADRNAQVVFTIPANGQSGSYVARVDTTHPYRRTGTYRIRCMLNP